jgi:xanthine dehydrogenase accessory factor
VTKWISDLAGELAHGRCAVIVTIAHAAGSTPREAGATMVVGDDGFGGSIGGGHLEFEALKIARDALANPATPTSTWIVRFPLAAKLGQCCGGVATLAFTKIAAGPHMWLDAAMTCVRDSMPFALVTRVGGSQEAPSRLLVTMNDAHGSLADGVLETSAIAMARAQLAGGQRGAGLLVSPAGSTTTMLIDIVGPDLFPVLIFGNGHVGRALVQVLGVLPAHVRWIDVRDTDFPPDVPANTEIVITDAPEDEIRHAPLGAFIVVMTHSHPLDFALIEAALKRDDWRYLGLIGSKAKRAQLERRLIARGMPASSLARVICPIGMRGGIGIHGKEPGAIAIAVAAEMAAVREAAALSADSTLQCNSVKHLLQSKYRV